MLVFLLVVTQLGGDGENLTHKKFDKTYAKFSVSKQLVAEVDTPIFSGYLKVVNAYVFTSTNIYFDLVHGSVYVTQVDGDGQIFSDIRNLTKFMLKYLV